MYQLIHYELLIRSNDFSPAWNVKAKLPNHFLRGKLMLRLEFNENTHHTFISRMVILEGELYFSKAL